MRKAILALVVVAAVLALVFLTWSATMASWEVPAGGGPAAGWTNTGLGFKGSNLLIGDFDNERIVEATTAGVYVGEVELASAPNNSVQGVAWDTGRSKYVAAHYAASGSAGSIRVYGTDGSLETTYATASVGGPNDIVYDAANDRYLACFDDGHVRGYDAADGSLDEDITLAASLGTGSGGGPDGLDLDPSDSTRLWVSADTTPPQVAKVNRSTGAVVSTFRVPVSAEGLQWLGGKLYLCCDQLFHASVTNGNRVWELDATTLAPTDTEPLRVKVQNVSISTAGTINVTGVGFTPRAAIFMGCFSGSGVTAAEQFGVCDQQLNQWCESYRAHDNVTTIVNEKGWSSTNCIYNTNGSGSVAFSAPLTSWTHDGCLLDVTNPSAITRSFVVLFLGGGDLRANAGIFDLTTSAGTQAVTGVGFQPVAVLFGENLSNTTPGIVTTETRFSLGAMTSAAQWCMTSVGIRGGTVNTTSEAGVGRTDNVFVRVVTTDLSTSALAAYSSLDSDGFTLNKGTPPGANLRFGYLALGGNVQLAVGAFNQPNATTGNQAVTGLGFQPSAVLFASAKRTTSTSATAHSRVMLGAAASSSARGVAAATAQNGVTTTNTARYENLSACLAAITDGGTPTANSVADFVSNDSGGFTVNWTTCDATQRQIFYMTIGAAAASGGARRRRLLTRAV